MRLPFPLPVVAFQAAVSFLHAHSPLPPSGKGHHTHGLGSSCGQSESHPQAGDQDNECHGSPGAGGRPPGGAEEPEGGQGEAAALLGGGREGWRGGVISTANLELGGVSRYVVIIIGANLNCMVKGHQGHLHKMS